MTDDATRPTPTPGGGDPTKSDDHDIAGLRTDLGGSAPANETASPAPGGDREATTGIEPAGATTVGADVPRASDTPSASAAADDPAATAHPLGGQLGAASGGYGSGSGFASSGGSPDGEDVDLDAGPGPQTDWMRSAEGAGPSGTAESGRGQAGRGPRDSDALGE